ncbi:MAG: disulfide bond formation protein B [Rhizobiaceae bacterium]
MNEAIPTSTTRSALYLGLAMASVVVTALAFEHIGGYIPCKLCLEQREPYYLGAPLMLLAALSAHMKWPACLTRGLLAICGLLMAYGLSIAVYHSGVEWAWWAGPTDCAAATTNVTTNANDLLNDINALTPPSCDKAALRIAGLSMAGWNAIASFGFLLAAFGLARR